MSITWLIEERLAASGMIHPDEIPRLRERGIGAVLSLSRRSPFPDGPPEGIEHLHLPVTDMTAPRPEDLERAVRFLRRHIDAGRAALVHCGAGLGRTGTVLACFLVAEGRDPEEAIRMVRRARPGSIETLEQEETVRTWRPGASRRGGRS